MLFELPGICDDAPLSIRSSICCDPFLLVAGGGAVTFGAPMVLHAAEPNALFERLRALEAAAEASGGRAGGGTVLQFHNFVNNADVVRPVLASIALPGICTCRLRNNVFWWLVRCSVAVQSTVQVPGCFPW